MYKSNKFRMTFAPFTDLNQHMQSILLGDALLEDETTKTFVWLFYQFRRCMFNKLPNAIITDHDAAICKALSLVPRKGDIDIACGKSETRARASSGYRSRYPNFNQVYRRWVSSNTPAKFEAG